MTFEEDKNLKQCNICKDWFEATEENFYSNQRHLYPYCKKCAIEKTKKWINDNPDRYKENCKRRDENLCENTVLYLQKNTKRQRENGYLKEYQNKNKDKMRKYRENRLHKIHTISDSEWEDCKKYFNYECAYCGLKIEDHFKKRNNELISCDFHKEHFENDGSNDLSNCIPSCVFCNTSKLTSNFYEWYTEKNKNFSQERYDKIVRWINEDFDNYMQKHDKR
jgi:hypothetical protein